MRILQGLRSVLWGQFDTSFDSRIGQGVDATGFTTLTKDASARYIYVKSVANGGNDSNSGLTDALAKATLNAGLNLLRQGFGDWMLVDKNSTFTEGFGAISSPRIDGISAAFPSVITTYDATDPSNTAKFRLGTFAFGTAPTASLLDISFTSALSQYLYFENGRCQKPLPTQSNVGTDWQSSLLAGDGRSVMWMFYNFTFFAGNFAVQGDTRGDNAGDPAYNFTGNTTIGSPNITGVVLTGGNAPTGAPFPLGIVGFGPTSPIPDKTVVVTWTPGTSTIVMTKNALSTQTGVTLNCGSAGYWITDVIFRRCVFAYAYSSGAAHACGMHPAFCEGVTVEDSVFYHNGWIGTNRNAIADVVMSTVASGNGATTVTLGGTGTGSFTATRTNGSATLTNCTLVSGYITNANNSVVTGTTLSGTGITGGTTIATWNPGISPDIFKHNLYAANSSFNMKIRRNLFGHGSSYGLQARGGGQVSDNVFVKNPLAYLLGGGDVYDRQRAFGVTISGGNNITIGSEDQDVGNPRGYAAAWINTTVASSLTREIIANGGVTTSGSPLGFGSSSNAFNQPNAGLLSYSIVYNWPNTDGSLAASEAGVAYPAQNLVQLTNNQPDVDTTWNNYGSGNTTGTSYPSPTRTIDTYATANGYANEQAFWDYAILHPEVNWAQSIQSYVQAGFGH